MRRAERGAQRHRQIGRGAARQIAREQRKRNLARPDQRVARAGDSRFHRWQAIFVDAETLLKVKRVIAVDHRHRIIAHRCTFGCGPAILANAVATDLKGQGEFGARTAVAQAQLEVARAAERKAARHRLTDDMLHVDRLALADQAAIEDAVNDFVSRRIAERQVKIIGTDAIAPIGQSEAEIAIAARRDHQRGAVALVATRRGFGLGQSRSDKTALRIARAARELTSAAAVGNADIGTRDRRGAIERRHPGKRTLTTPFEMHRHIGDECCARDIARLVAPEQRTAKRGAGKLDDIESGRFERNADNFKRLATSGRGEVDRAAAATEQCGVAGMVDRNRLAALLNLLRSAFLMRGDIAQPFGNLAIGRVNAQHRAAERFDALRELRFDRAQRDREHATLIGFDDPEIGSEFDKRWRRIDAHREREAQRIGKRPTALVDHIGGQPQRCGARGGKRAFERYRIDGRASLLVGIVPGFEARAIGERQADRARLGDRHWRGEIDRGILNRVTASLRIDAAALKTRGERVADRKIIALIAASNPPVSRSNIASPDERDILAGRQGAAALDRDQIGRGRLPVACLRMRHPRIFKKIADFPAVGAERAEHGRRGLARQHVERNFLANAFDSAIAGAADRARARRCVGRDQKRLILFDIIAIFAGQNRARSGATRIDCKVAQSGDRKTAGAFQIAVEAELAGDSARQRGFKFIHIGLGVGPAAASRDSAAHHGRGGRARVAERDHRFGKTQGVAIDRAAMAAATTGGGDNDLRCGFANRGERKGNAERGKHQPQNAKIQNTLPDPDTRIALHQAQISVICKL